MKIYALFVLTGFLFLAGCSTVTKTSDASLIPSSRMYQANGPSEKNSAELRIQRDPDPTGHVCYYAIFIEKKLAARIAPNEEAVFNLEPGKTTISVKRDPNDEHHCASLESMLTDEPITLAKDEKKSLRLTFLADGWPVFRPLPSPVPSPSPSPTSTLVH